MILIFVFILGTFKVHAARKRPDIIIVTPDWLWCCAERWECVEEKLFPLDPASKPSSKMRQPPAHCHSPGKPKLLLNFVGITVANTAFIWLFRDEERLPLQLVYP